MMLGLFGGAAGRMAGGMSRNLGRDPKVQRRAGLMSSAAQPQRPRGLFGRAANFLQNERGGVSNLDRIRLAAAYMRDDPSFAMAAERGIADQRAMYNRREEIEQERRNQASQAKLEGVQRQQEIQRLYALEDQYGLDRGALSMLPEDARSGVISELAARRFTPEAPDAPTTRTVNRGGETVTEQWNPQAGRYEEIGRAPRWNPNAGPLVNVNTGEGQQPSPYASAYEAATEARTESILTDIGPAAERKALQLDRLDGLLAANETGIGAAARLYASDFGLEIGDNVGELQAARALINTLVPELRPPNSGTFTDADARLARESLPRLINTPGGNELVMGTLRRINDYDRQLYRLTQQVGRGEITPQQYEDAVSALANPLDPVREALNGTRADQASDGPAPTRITSDDEYDRLPSGALYIGPDGITRRKP